jgi:hypothetical protein
MNTIQRLISAGFAAAALTSISVPALAYSVWPDVDFQWYAQVGKDPYATGEIQPAPRAGLIWSPGHWERRDSGRAWVGGHWVRDDFYEQVAAYGHRPEVAAATPPPNDSGDRAERMSQYAYPTDPTIMDRR